MTQSDMTKVVAVPTTVDYGGKKYGPFRATKAKPYTEVPTVLALGLGLPEYAGEPDVPTAASGGTQDPATKTEGGPGELPADFPERDLLTGTTFTSLEAIRAASDEDLLAVDGIGPAKLKAIRAAQG